MEEPDDNITVTMPTSEVTIREFTLGTRVRIVDGAAPESRTLLPDPDGSYEINERAPVAGEPEFLRFIIRKIG